MRSRLCLAVLLAVLVVASLASSAGARVRNAPDLPPSDRAALARMFDPALRPLGLRTTRAALQDLDSYDRSRTGRHLAVYVEPIKQGDVDRAVYVRNIMKTARIFLPFVYREWSDLESFDVCQEPERHVDPRSAPAPVTQLIVLRSGAVAVQWKHASLATLLERADAVDARGGGEDPLSLYVSPQVAEEPAYQAAVGRARLAPETTTSAPAD